MNKDEKIVNKYRTAHPWGMSVTVDLKDCNPELIRSEPDIKKFVTELCDLIKMRKFGDTQVVDFGEDERVSGFSMTQLIETSLISGHFANQTNAAYIDIFSCKGFGPFLAAKFCKKFFKAKSMKVSYTFRY